MMFGGTRAGDDGDAVAEDVREDTLAMVIIVVMRQRRTI